LKKLIKITENDLLTIIRKVIEEQNIKDINVKKLQNDKNDTWKYVDNTAVLPKKRPPTLLKGTLKYSYSCIYKNTAVMSAFVNMVVLYKERLKKDLGVNNDTLLYLTKIAIGIMGWQSAYASDDKLYDIGGTEFFGLNPYDIYKGLNRIGEILGYDDLGSKTFEKASKTVKNIGSLLNKNWSLDEPTFGPAEFMPSVYTKTGVEKKYGYGFETAIGSGLAVMHTIYDAYKIAIKNGLSSSSSENYIAKLMGVPAWDEIKGTGNHLWDVAISTHTWPSSKMLIKYCKTNRPDFSGPCDKTTYRPFNTESSWQEYIDSPGISTYYKKNPQLSKFPGDVKVLSGQPILNYYPHLIGSHGDYSKSEVDSKYMMEWVVISMNRLTCIDVAFK